MILTQDHKPPRRQRAEQWLLAGLAMVLLFSLGYILLAYRPVTDEGTPPEEMIYCDAERVQGRHFVRGDWRFSKGEYQSREKARSGWYSCRVPAGEGAQYGFGYRLEGTQAGEVYRASVWRYKNIQQEGKLAVRGLEDSDLYYETDEVRGSDHRGWELLQITFHIPYHSQPGPISIYTYTNGYQAVFFDDLRIEKIDVWDAAVFEPQVLSLQLGPRARKQLERKREEAIRAGVLFSESEDWVNGRIAGQKGDASIPVRLRLKGDWLDHLSNDKWSFRIKVRDPYQWRQLKVFSVHTPAARYHLHEWLLHRLWQREDVLSPRYDFVELHINGQSRGIYAYEEHFTKQLIEAHRRREGPILKLAEDGLWAAYQRQLNEHGFIVNGSGHSAAAAENADITAFEESSVLNDTLLGRQYRIARRMLRGFLEGSLPARRVFDLDRMAAYYAACDIMNAYHGVVWHNQRFYYNPITDRLEPIGFDGFGGPPQDAYTILAEGALNPQSLMSNSLVSRLLQDPEFAARYVRKLYKLSSRDYLDVWLSELEADWTARKRWLQMEFPGYRAELADIRQRARYVHSLVLPYEEYSLKAHTLPGSPRRVVLGNTHTLPLQLVGWGSSRRGPDQNIADERILAGQLPRLYLARLRADSLITDFASLRFLEAAAMEKQYPLIYDTLIAPASADYVFYRPMGLDTLFYSRIHPLPPGDQFTDLSMGSDSDTLVEKPYYRIRGKRVIWLPGEHRIHELVVIPKGYELHIPPGTTLILEDGAGLLSRSPLQAIGTAESPIRILASGSNSLGCSVMNAPNASVLRYVSFTGLNTLRQGSWQLTGGVNFYESSVQLDHCRFTDNRGEDALNIIRSEFSMSNCLFSDIYSDAFDSDFSKGEIRNCIFRRTGNDGLDLSGSIVNVYDCRFDTHGDKGISVGEDSDAHIFDSSIRGAPIALAAKDQSMAFVRNMQLTNCDQGFVAFQKKPEYGGANIVVESYRAENVRRLYVAADGSRVQLNHSSQ